MNCYIILASLLCLSLLPITAANSQEADLELLQGTWEVVSDVYDGKEMPCQVGKRTTIIGNTWTVYNSEGVATWSIEIRVDQTQMPAHMDFIRRTSALPGIYELYDDTLTTCTYSIDGPDGYPPFLAHSDYPEDSHVNIMTFTRVMDDDAGIQSSSLGCSHHNLTTTEDR